MARFLLLAGAVAALALGALALSSPHASPPASGSAETIAPASAARLAQRPETDPPSLGLELAPPENPPPPSLRGTQPSGGLEVDASGHFVPTRAALLFFEYYLSALHEEAAPELVDRMRRAIRQRLDPPADAEAEAFLGSYLAYREAGEAEFGDARVAASSDLSRRLQWIREQRRAHFGAALAERLFGDEEHAVRLQLEMRRVREAPSLDAAEKRRRLDALEQQLPESARAARGRAAAPLRLARDERRLREAGASEGEIDALRAERFGPEAAERLRALDLERAEWEARLARYRTERAALRERGSDPETEQAELDSLRAAHFEPAEVERVRILDRIEKRSR